MVEGRVVGFSTADGGVFSSIAMLITPDGFPRPWVKRGGGGGGGGGPAKCCSSGSTGGSTRSVLISGTMTTCSSLPPFDSVSSMLAWLELTLLTCEPSGGEIFRTWPRRSDWRRLEGGKDDL